MGSLTSEYMFSKCSCCKKETTWGLQGAAMTVGTGAPWAEQPAPCTAAPWGRACTVPALSALVPQGSGSAPGARQGRVHGLNT